MSRKHLPDLLIVILLFLLPLAFFAPVTLGGRTLIPAENLYQWEPFATYREVVDAPDVPHNSLLSDLVLENYAWKQFIRESIGQRELPLWNPYLFGGVPFLAAGQHSAIYPLSLLHYVLPLSAAYGWYAVIQLWLAGVWMFLLARGLGQRRFGAVVAAVSWQLSAFFLVRTVFPMIQSAASWLPLLILMVEYVIRSKPAFGRPSTLPWVTVGAVSLGLVIYAGHIEITYYTLLIMGIYAASRLLAGYLATRREAGAFGRLVRRGAWLLAMVIAGLLLGAAQFLPLFELVQHNFREGSATLEQIMGWAYPKRRVLAFLMPNFFGSPAHHSYFDVFRLQTVPATVNALGQPVDTIYWGIKNYVEGGQYLGILPLILAGFGLVSAWGSRRGQAALAAGRPYRGIMAGLAGVSLTFIFGLPTYALLYYLLPGINQLHSPFRWVFPLTFAVAVLAGYGADSLIRRRGAGGAALPPGGDPQVATADPLRGSPPAPPRLTRLVGLTLTAAGLLMLAALLASRLFYPQIAPLLDRALHSLALADQAFADAAMFYSYQFTNVLLLGVLLTGSGLVFLLSRRDWSLRGLPLWQIGAVAIIALDLMIATAGFNPAADPALLDFTPPVFEWLDGQQNPADPFRITTYDAPGADTANANIPWLFDVQDVRGYDSIIPRQYTDYMARIATQYQLDFNRVAPLPDWEPQALNSPWLDALSVRYVITQEVIDAPNYTLAYEDEAVRVYENTDVLPRAYTLPLEAGVTYSDPAQLDELISGGVVNPHEQVLVYDPDGALPDTGEAAATGEVVPQPITGYSNIQVMVDATVTDPALLALGDSYFDGWRAYVRPAGADDSFEWQLPIYLVNGNFRGVLLHPAELADHYADAVASGDVMLSDTWTVRFRYSPQPFQTGVFLSFMTFMALLFAGGVYLWRTFYLSRDDSDDLEVQRLAKNSIMPIVMNLFNKGIDFAFAFIMLRVLGPGDAGIYYYAIVVFGWFDILTNFGLNTFLTREVARDHARAGRYMRTTSLLRIGLSLLGVPLLVAFLLIRQGAVTPPLSSTALFAILLLYLGLIPGSLNTGFSALFYAFEKAEYPAATATVGTISKAVLGLGALLAGWGVVGLAGASILTNLLIFGLMLWLARPLIWPQERARGGVQEAAPEPDTLQGRPLVRHMLGESWPLMLNHLLATVFYKIDVILMEAINGVTVVGWYSTAYKWLDALQVIPAFLSAALLPVLSRQAQDDTAQMVRTYRISVKLLFMVALPVAVGTTFIAPTLVLMLGGSQYLPDGGVALQLMIWSIPIGWINSVTQYVLIALDRQRTLTGAFIVAVTFNIIANLVFLPAYSYRAAAVITILSEGLLLALFLRVLGQTLQERLPDDTRSVSLVRALWRPGLAGAGMFAALLALWPLNALLALGVGIGVYIGGVALLRPFDTAEQAQLMPLLPGRLRTWASARQAASEST